MVDVWAMYVDLATRYWWVLIFGIAGLILWWIITNATKNKPALKAVNRAEVERKNFLRRMDFNISKRFKLLVQDGTPRLLITRFLASEFKLKDAETPQKVFEIIARKPIFIFGIKLPFKSRPEAYIFNADNIYIDSARPTELNLKLGITLWEKMGVFYDNTLSETVIETFTRQFNAQTDYESLSAEFYAASQEAAVIDRDRAHMTLSDHLALEQIKEKKRISELAA